MITTLLETIYNSLEESYENNEWFKLVLKVIALQVVLICTGLVLLMVAVFIIEHIEKIVIVIGAVASIVIIFLSFIPKKAGKPEALPETVLEYDPITLETTYRLIRKNICSVVGDVYEIIKVRKPTNLSQMDCPTHYDVVAKAIIYHLLLTKTSEKFDAMSASGILQNALEQRLNNNELDGITQTAYFYNGQIFPAIMVDNVREMGNYVQIDIAIASDYYCKYRERRIYESLSSSNSSNIYDRDF
jgi:hypothetical protein